MRKRLEPTKKLSPKEDIASLRRAAHVIVLLTRDNPQQQMRARALNASINKLAEAASMNRAWSIEETARILEEMSKEEKRLF